MRPLEGVRVLDLSHYIAGPISAMHLADAGAEVIKVESLDGEVCRKLLPFANNKSLYFNSYNRNKKGITLNLKSERGINLFKELVKKSDVIIENFRPGTMHKLGCGYETLSQINPGIIMTSITGYGEASSMSNKSAFDMTVQGVSGIMYLSTPENTDPVKLGAPVGDYASGMYATMAILTALLEKNKSGHGQYIDIALFDSLLSIQEYHPFCTLHTDENPARPGNRRLTSSPSNLYKTKDGYIYITCGNDPLWEKMAKLMNREELINNDGFESVAARVKNADIVDEIVIDWLSKYTTDEASELLDNAGVPNGPVLTMKETIKLPIVKEREMIIELKDADGVTLYAPGSPMKFSRTPIVIDRAAPVLGQHNWEIYSDVLGLTSDEINELKTMAII